MSNWLEIAWASQTLHRPSISQRGVTLDVVLYQLKLGLCVSKKQTSISLFICPSCPIYLLSWLGSGLFGQRALVAPGRDTNNVLCTLVTNHQCEVKVRKQEIGEAMGGCEMQSAGAKTTLYNLTGESAFINPITIYICIYFTFCWSLVEVEALAAKYTKVS